jgi:hypothetical protein
MQKLIIRAAAAAAGGGVHGAKKKRLLSLTKWDTKKGFQEISLIVHEVTLRCVHTLVLRTLVLKSLNTRLVI